jgi:hypothetical protein
MFGISRKAIRDSVGSSSSSENGQNNKIIGSVTPAPSPNSSPAKLFDDSDGAANKQCSCPCKALAQLTAQKESPLAVNGSSQNGGEGTKAEAEEDMDLVSSQQVG